jgi:WD40 repeat protein
MASLSAIFQQKHLLSALLCAGAFLPVSSMQADPGGRADIRFPGIVIQEGFAKPVVPDAIPFQSLNGHNWFVSQAVFSPDGQIVATASGDSTIGLWNAPRGWQISRLEGHKSYVYSVAFSPDSKLCISTGADGQAILWDVEAGRLLRSITIDPVSGYTAVFSPDGKSFATGGWNGTLDIWDTETGARIASKQIAPRLLLSLAYSPDGQYLATGDGQGTIQILETATWRQIRTFAADPEEQWYVQSLSFSPDGLRLLSSARGPQSPVIMWDWRNSRRIFTIHGTPAFLVQAKFSPRGTWIATSNTISSIKVRDSYTGEEISTIGTHDQLITNINWNNDGSRIISCDAGASVKIWEHTPEPEQESLPEITGTVLSGNPRTAASVKSTPNPTSGQVVVQTDIKVAGNARLELRDLLGRTVAVLFDGPLSSGQHSFGYDAAELTTGAYHLVLIHAAGSTLQRVDVQK